MRAGWLIAIALVLAACKGHKGLSIKRDLKSKTTKATGLPGEHLGSLADARPSVTIKGTSGALADGMKKKLESSMPAKRGAVQVEATSLDPASPGADGTLNAVLVVHALFAHPPNVSKLDGTLTIKLEYENATAEQLGDNLGDAINGWFADEKLPLTDAPTKPPAKITSIAVGPPSCTLHEDSSVRCWEYGGTEAVPIPAAAGTLAIDAENNYGACGVKARGGGAWCMDAWSNVVALEVRDVCGVTDAKDISVGQANACALLGNGHVQCWPRDESYFAPCDGHHGAIEIQGVTDAVALDAGAFEGCVVRKDGTVQCWTFCGKDCKSAVAGQIDPDHPPKATTVKGLAKARFAFYPFQPCALLDDNHVKCVSDDKLLQKEATLPDPVKTLGHGLQFCASTTKGDVYCWSTETPVKVDGISDVQVFATGLAGSCAVNSKNEITCWGGMSGSDPPKSIVLAN